jgi:hypothetical protein
MTMEDHVITVAGRSEEFRICVARAGEDMRNGSKKAGTGKKEKKEVRFSKE